MYELLGLIKDGKAPKKIKYDDKIWDYSNEDQDYYNLDETDNLFGHLFNDLTTNSFINNYVEIIEEPKKIEKLEPVRGSDLSDLTDKDMILRNNALVELCKTLNNMNNKINELIDEINNLKEK